jgi:predicted esterase
VVERHVRVPRTARYHVLGEPVAAEEVWFGLHGYGQLASQFMERLRALPGAGETRAVVAPEGLSRFYIEGRIGAHGQETRVGASWMTRVDRDREIADYVEYLDRVVMAVVGGGGAGSAVVPRRVVLGFSQGAETASRWAVLGSVRPAELILWGGGLAADLDMARAAEALVGVEVRFVVGDDDRWGRERAEASVARLLEVGVEPVVTGYRGGHRLEAAVLERWWPRPGQDPPGAD